jgi:hypothetical protein
MPLWNAATTETTPTLVGLVDLLGLASVLVIEIVALFLVLVAVYRRDKWIWVALVCAAGLWAVRSAALVAGSIVFVSGLPGGVTGNAFPDLFWAVAHNCARAVLAIGLLVMLLTRSGRARFTG